MELSRFCGSGKCGPTGSPRAKLCGQTLALNPRAKPRARSLTAPVCAIYDALFQEIDEAWLVGFLLAVIALDIQPI